MSHTLDFETVISDQDALVRALKRMGVPESLIEVHNIPKRLNTYHTNENKVAHVIVRRALVDRFSGKHSDIGWERNDEGLYVGHVDGYAYDGSPCYDEDWQTRLYTYCMVETAKIAMEKQGEEYTEEHDKLGRIVLRTKLKDKAPVNKYKIQVRATR